MTTGTILTQEEIDYVHENILFFSIEHNEEYLHFYRDGSISLTSPNDRLLSDLHCQFKHDDFGQTFYRLKERVTKLKNNFKGFVFHHDVILVEEDND
jgi:hypothetical protein